MKKEKDREETKKVNQQKLLAKFGFSGDEDDDKMRAIENWERK